MTGPEFVAYLKTSAPELSAAIEHASWYETAEERSYLEEIYPSNGMCALRDATLEAIRAKEYLRAQRYFGLVEPLLVDMDTRLRDCFRGEYEDSVYDACFDDEDAQAVMGPHLRRLFDVWRAPEAEVRRLRKIADAASTRHRKT